MPRERYLPNYTVEDYLRWEGDWELIDGVPSAMSPAPSPLHQIFAKSLVTQLDNTIMGKGDDCGNCEVVYELDWFIDSNTVLKPDIAIVCDLNFRERWTKRPDLVVEILSPTSGLKDRHTKFGIYEEQQVPYYLIVDPERKSYNAFIINNGKYEETEDFTSLKLHGQCVVNIDLAQAFARLKQR